MKFEFNPKVEVTPQERVLLKNFFHTVEEACNNATCDGCILAAVCDQHENVVHFLDAIFEALGI